jgi:hypothetical protein
MSIACLTRSLVSNDDALVKIATPLRMGIAVAPVPYSTGAGLPLGHSIDLDFITGLRERNRPEVGVAFLCCGTSSGTLAGWRPRRGTRFVLADRRKSLRAFHRSTKGKLFIRGPIWGQGEI